jgi:hypothetical protein
VEAKDGGRPWRREGSRPLDRVGKKEKADEHNPQLMLSYSLDGICVEDLSRIKIQQGL